MIIDLAANPKQEIYFNTLIESANGLNEYRNLHYGGAIRGGKTFVSLTGFGVLCKMFPGSRWHVIRADFPALQATAIPSMEKILAGTFNWKWNRDKSNFFVYNQKSDSKIFFKGENYERDPEGLDFLGLETNGFLFEQIEEIRQSTYQMGQSRAGSWYIDKMPMPLMLDTFNPTQSWIKKMVYDPWSKDELKPPHFFMNAKPTDNAFVTQEQFKAWGNMAERYQKQYIDGDWTDFSNQDNLWAFAFNFKKHVGKIEYNPKQITYLSFDFNRNPICCGVIQWYNGQIKVVKAFKLNNSDIYKLCDQINATYPNATFMVTGDASGNNGSAMVKDNANYYRIIKQKLNLSDSQIRVPKANPHLDENQVLVNSILTNYSCIFDEENAQPLIFDCMNVKMLPSGQIDKGDRNDPTMQADSIDWLRYWMNVFMWDFLKVKPKS